MNIPGLRRQPPTPGAGVLFGRPALTAAAQSGNPDRNRPKEKLRRLHQDWQLRALATYDTVGECWYPSQFYARSLAKTRFFPAVLNDRGEPEEQETGPLVDLFDRVRDPGSAGRSELAASYGRLQFLNGDGYLTVTQDDDGETWEYLSVAELKIDPEDRPDKPQRYRRLRAPGAKSEELSEAPDDDFEPLKGKDVRVWRLWRPHPMHTQLADAPIRAVLELYELLHRLTLAAAAEASSRAANRGMLYIAREIVDGMGFTLGPDDDPESHPFFRALAEGLEAAISNPGTAGAMSPFVAIGPASVPGPQGSAIPLKDMLGWFQMGPTDRYTEGEMWEKTIQRIGNGLDLPRQILDGEARNHWGDWLIDEQGYRQHVAPVTERFCSDVASAYLRPAAKAEGFGEWARVVVGYDPADAILHPDQTSNAFEAYDRKIVGEAFVRDKIGATDDDAPTEEELAARQPPPVADSTPPGETPPQGGGTGGDVNETPPTQNGSKPAVTASAAPTQSALQAAKIMGAAEMQVARARELAGHRLVRRAQSCEDCKKRIAMVPPSLVASALGVDTVREIIDGHTTETALVGGIGATLANTLRTWGLDGEWPAKLGVLVEQHALRTLYDEVPPAFPSAFSAAVAKALR